DAPVRIALEDASEPPGVERAIRDQADSEGAQCRDQLHLDGARSEVVQALLRGQTQEVARRGGALSKGHVPGGEIAAADVADLAVADQLLHRLPDLFPR